MHHLYPSLKGDQLCPLGFHPQTRYPTRCKRCFRDYKEHGGRRGMDDVAASSPNLSDGSNSRPSSRTWTSTQNLSSVNGSGNDIELKKRPQSWASTPDIDEVDNSNRNSSSAGEKSSRDEHNVDVTLKLPVPPRRHTTSLDIKEVENNLSRNSSASSSSKNIPEDLIILSTDSLAERVRKMNLLKKQRSQNSRESSRERSIPRKQEQDSSEGDSKSQPDRPERTKTLSSANTLSGTSDPAKHLSLPPKKTASSNTSSTISSHTRPTSTPVTETNSTIPPTPAKTVPTKLKTTSTSSNTTSSLTSSSLKKKENERIRAAQAAQDVQFMLNIKENSFNNKKKNEDNMSLTTETPYACHQLDRENLDEVVNLRKELEAMKTRAEKAEREKSDILLRRLASMETAPNRTAASEAIMLQQKVNELKEQLEKITEEKRKLNARMKELENNPKSAEYELRRKLQAAEQICEELLEENQEAKKEIINLQAEMDELQDTFRDDEVKAKTCLQKELEKTTKNCRILSFKLKKCERKIESLEQERQSSSNAELHNRIKQLEDELRFSQELAKKLQVEAEDLRNPGKKKTPMLGILGKSTSADGKFTRESLTRGGSQEDPQQLLRDLQDSVERESDLKEQLKFAEEEAENLRKKVARMEDENDSLMMQLKKMATRSRNRKLSPTPHRLAPEVNAERDEGISDDDDPAELRILLELNEQEASILRQKVEELEKQYSESKKQVRELQDKLSTSADKKSTLSPWGSNNSEKKLKALNDELEQLRSCLSEKDNQIKRLESSITSQIESNAQSQLETVEKEVNALRSKITALEAESERFQKENKRLKMQALRKQSSTDKSESDKLKESFSAIEKERDHLQTKLKRILLEADEKLPPRTAVHITDLTPKNQLKKWVEELDDEIKEMRAIVINSDAHTIKGLETEKKSLEEELKQCKLNLTQAETNLQKFKSTSATPKVADLEKQLKKSEEESKQMNSKIKELEDKIKKQDNLIKKIETTKASFELQYKTEKEKLSKLEKDHEKEHKEREKLAQKLLQKETELAQVQKAADKTKGNLENEIKELKAKSSKSDSKQVQDLKKQLEDLHIMLDEKTKRYSDLNAQWEKLSEETVLMRAQLSTEKNNLQTELNNAKQKVAELEAIRVNRSELAKKLNDAQKKIQELETKTLKSGHSEYEKTMLQHKLDEKIQEYDRLRRENEMNIDLIFQLRKDNDELNRKLNDFSRIEQAQSSINGHNASLENEIKSLKMQLKNTEIQLKSEVASTRLRYEQQVKTLSGELTSMHRQCERFKKDRDAFKQMLESAQKKIGDLKANNAGRQSRGSMHSSDEDDKSKIAYLEQQVGCLEDQLVDARLEASKVKTELVSERSANEIKISEMQSKLNEFEEERVIGSGRTKIPGMKSKLELSWQKEREDQQRLLQETSTLARDLRQTLFEVERERDKERLESKRRLDQLKRTNEEEMEEGRRKIAELQCDLLELRDVHAKLRTSNEKLRRERERYEKELVKRRMEQEGSDRKLSTLLHTVDELVKIAPNIVGAKSASPNDLRPEALSPKRSRSPSPSMNTSNVSSVLARLTEALEDLRKFQRINQEEHERNRIRRSMLRRAASQENDPCGSQSSVASAAGSNRNSSKLSRSSQNGNLTRKSLSLDHSIQQDQNIWRQDDGSVSSMQSIESELGGMVRDSSYDSRLSGGSTQSDIPRGPRKKKKGLMGKLRSLTKSGRNSESEISIQGSDSDISVASDMRSSKKDLRGRLSGMFKRSGSASRSASTERTSSEQRPVAVTVVGDADGPQPRDPPPANSMTPKPIRSISKPPTPTPTTPLTRRRVAKQQ